jgi:hypothetical protein
MTRLRGFHYLLQIVQSKFTVENQTIRALIYSILHRNNDDY